MAKREQKSKTGKIAPPARSKTSASKARGTAAPAARPVAARGPSAKSVAAKSIATKSIATKAGSAKPASAKPAVKARSVTRAAQKQADKKLFDRAKASAIVLPPDYRPSEDEPFMNEYQRLYFRQKLLTWKEDIIRQTKETLEGLHEDSVQHADLADRATSETDRALELRARDRQRKLISKIDAALARIEDGTYGYCEETGEPIGLKRLDARPIATLSLEAQERHERRERVYRED